MQLKIYSDGPQTLIELANHFIELAEQTIKKNGLFSVVLSGGSSPKGLYELLASKGYAERVDWDKVYFFFGDERYVPFNDDSYNGLMAKKALFDPLGISDKKIFYVDTVPSPEEAATAYTNAIQSFFGDKPVSFDLVLLGLGDNAHTASLFPFTTVLKDTANKVSAVYVEEVKMYRITMTATMINAAKEIVFLVFGKGKAEAVHQILEEPTNYERYPAQLIQPVTGETFWYLDKAAASELTSAK